MPQDNDVLVKKAFAIAHSIAQMPPEIHHEMPTKIFGDDYNTLRDLAAEANPKLNDVLPPKVNIEEYGAGSQFYSTQPYCEIRCFCRQIAELL